MNSSDDEDEQIAFSRRNSYSLLPSDDQLISELTHDQSVKRGWIKKIKLLVRRQILLIETELVKDPLKLKATTPLTFLTVFFGIISIFFAGTYVVNLIFNLGIFFIIASPLPCLIALVILASAISMTCFIKLKAAQEVNALRNQQIQVLQAIKVSSVALRDEKEEKYPDETELERETFEIEKLEQNTRLSFFSHKNACSSGLGLNSLAMNNKPLSQLESLKFKAQK